MTRISIIFLFSFCLLLSGCSTHDSPTVDLVAKRFKVVKIEVKLARKVNYGKPSTDSESQKPLIDRTIDVLKRGLKKAIIKDDSNGKPATLEVVLDTLDLSSGEETQSLSNSRFGGQVSLIDAKTGKTVTKKPIYVSDKSTNTRHGVNDLALGSAFSLFSNLGKSPEEKRINAVVNPFIAIAKGWFGRD